MSVGVRTMRGSPPRKAFTLLEALIAIVLLGAIIGVAIRLLGDVSDARSRVEASLRRTEGVTLAIDLLADRIATATTTAVDGGAGITGDALSCRVTGCGIASIRLDAASRRSPLLDRSTLELGWRDGGLSLRDDEGPWSLLAGDLAAIRFRYHDGDDWRDLWDSDQDGLPVAIEVEIWTTPWPDGLAADWMPEPIDPLDADIDAFGASDFDDSMFDDPGGFAPPPVPAEEDEIPLPDRRRVIAILDPVSTSSDAEASP